MFGFLGHRDDMKGPGGEPLYWGRADVDGAPFLGEPPAYREDEYNLRVTAKYYFMNAWFDTADAADNARYCQVMTMCLNGACRCIRAVPVPGTTKVYVEWAARYMVDTGPRQR